ncbi:MAG: L-threonylcarbamoyladenylate synthase [Pseudomonadota bacterium]
MSQGPALAEAVAALRRGGVVLHATEGVWGLACDPTLPAAVQRVFELKQRPGDRGLILIGGDASAFEPELKVLPAEVRTRVLSSWPGPNSWVLPTSRFSDRVTGGRETVAARVPGHDQARDLASAFGGPLVSTSANLSGKPAATSMSAADALGLAVDYRLPGEVLRPGVPSTLRLLSGEILRG